MIVYTPTAQAIAAGLLDELQLHVVPVLLGDGVRLFDPVDAGVLRRCTLERTQAESGDLGVTHLRYRLATSP